MAISEKDRAAWQRQVAALNRIELPPEVELTGPIRKAVFEMVNEERQAGGVNPLVNDEDELPEIGFHRLAIARGLAS